jgi:hypothetical protein
MKTLVHFSLFVLMSVLINSSTRGGAAAPGKDGVNLNEPEQSIAVEGFSINIDIRQPNNPFAEAGQRYRFEAGKTLYLVVVLTNVSKDNLDLTDTDAESDFFVALWDSKREPVPTTTYGKKLRLKRLSQWVIDRKVILPGKSLKYEINISRQFDLSARGTYTVQASRNVPEKEGRGRKKNLKSNMLVFELQ